jgi:hypothetical protein
VFWRDIDEGAWEGITAALTAEDVSRRPTWCVDVVYPGRVRLTAGTTARWWGRQRRGWEGVGMLRGEPMGPDDAVVRAITADDLRAVTETPGTVAWWRRWSRWFVEAMAASGRSPLRPGLWWLTPTHARDVASLTVSDGVRARDAGPSRWEAARAVIARAEGDPWTEDLFDESARLNGADVLLPLRRASPPDSGRVKMWRKRAREGTLPPVLVYDVSALTMFALLDGHDRYAAARAEGVPVPWLLVTALKFWPLSIDPKKQAALVAEAERMMARVPAVPTASINALYRLAHDDRPWPSRACYGRLLAGGAQRWDDEVTRRLGELGLSDEGQWLFE